ncbi:MAG TPA: ABC transporter permease [Pyrinomonadaceae bacterium]|nr:ABC transporter permease [Pyrinomonadaceae bacterium]
MDSLFKDIRYALRALLRHPGFTAVAVITLALGIGANTAIFSVVHGVLLAPLPYPESDRLVSLRQSNVMSNVAQPDAQISPGNFLEWQRQSTTFSSVAAYRTVSFNLTGDGNPERLLAGRVSSGLFTLLGVQPVWGRDFVAEEDRPGSEKVVIISEGLWRRRFGGSRDVLGKSLKLDGEDFTIVGVMSASFRMPDQRERELWTPIAFKDNEKTLYQARYIDAIARLKPEASVAQAQAEMSAIAARLAQEHPEANAGWTINVKPLLDFVVGDVKTILWVLFGAVALVLLIACANVTNLLLARATTRQKEMALRAALGASRWAIVRQLATESLLLALLGAAAAWPLATWALRGLVAAAPADLPRIANVTIDNRALLFTFGITLLTAGLFGLAPALQTLRFDVGVKYAGHQRSRSVRQQRIGNVLIASEVALALMLLVVGGLLVRTVWRLSRVDPGFDVHNTLAVTLQLPQKKYAEPAQIARVSTELVQQVSTLPSVEATGIARILPIVHDLPTAFYFEGYARPKENDLPQTNYSAVSPGYFKAMGIPLIAGRTFTDRDTQDGRRVAIISQTLAQRYFPDGDAIGRRINVNTGPEAYREIVGIVGDVKQNGLTKQTKPHTYEPFAQAPNQFMTLIVRSSGDPSSLVPAIRGKVLAIDSELPLQRVTTLDRVIANSIRQQRFTSLVLSVFAGVALLLAAAGLYGVISYSVAQRTHELGIRVALGAQVKDVMQLVLRQGMTFVIAGELIGIAGAFALTRLLGGLLFGVTPTDLPTFIAVTIVLTFVALAACYIPARRATKIDPLAALRHE